MKRLLLFALVVSGGCSSWTLESRVSAVSLTSAVPDARARVCVLRPSQDAAGVTFPVRDNGTLVGATQGGTRFCYLAEPGEHQIVSEADAPEPQTRVLEAGKSYYLRQDVDAVMGAVRCRTSWLDADQVTKAADQSRESVLVGAPGGETLPGQVPYAPLHPKSAVGSN